MRLNARNDRGIIRGTPGRNDKPARHFRQASKIVMIFAGTGKNPHIARVRVGGR